MCRRTTRCECRLSFRERTRRSWPHAASVRAAGRWTALVPIELALVLILVSSSGCFPDMADQPKYEPFEVSDFFADGQTSRPAVAGTVARGQLRSDEHFYTGKVGGKLATTIPLPVTDELLARGRERFEIFCSPCHDRVGTGRGTVVRRGFPQPPSYHSDRLRSVEVGHFFDVMTNGFGRMSDYAAQVPPEDRWAIAAYIRALQLSQHARRDELEKEDLRELQE